MTEPAPAEFLRFTPADTDSLERDIARSREQLALAQSAGHTAGILDHAGDLGGMLTAARREREACAVMEPLLPLARQHPSSEPAAWLLHALATALQYTGRRDEALVLFAEANDRARENDWLKLEHFVLHHQGRCLAELHRYPEARASFERSLAIRESLGDPKQESSRRALATLDDRESGIAEAQAVQFASGLLVMQESLQGAGTGAAMAGYLAQQEARKGKDD